MAVIGKAVNKGGSRWSDCLPDGCGVCSGTMHRARSQRGKRPVILEACTVLQWHCDGLPVFGVVISTDKANSEVGVEVGRARVSTMDSVRCWCESMKRSPTGSQREAAELAARWREFYSTDSYRVYLPPSVVLPSQSSTIRNSAFPLLT